MSSPTRPELYDPFYAPEPENAFEVAPAALESINAALAALNRPSITLNLNVRGNTFTTGHGLEETTCRNEVIDAGHDLFMECAEYIGASSINLAIDASPIAFGHAQRSSFWHRDRLSSPNKSFLLISDWLPTEFAVGTIPYESEFAQRLNHEAWPSVRSVTVDEAITQKRLKIYTPPGFTAQHFTREHIHRSQTNTTDELIEKTLIRVL